MSTTHATVDLNKLLKSLELAVKDPKNTLTKGVVNPLTNTLQREALTAFLTTVVMNKSFEVQGEKILLSVCKNEKEDKHDGYLKVTFEDSSEKELELEQIMLTEEEVKGTDENTDISDLIIAKIEQKHGKPYTNPEDLTLMIFLDIKGQTIPAKVKEHLKTNKKFYFYILAALNQSTDKTGLYTYTLIDLDPDRADRHSRFSVILSSDFNSYDVTLTE